MKDKLVELSDKSLLLKFPWVSLVCEDGWDHINSLKSKFHHLIRLEPFENTSVLL